MLKFIVRRIFWTIPVLLVVIFLTFMMMRQIEGNPFRKTGAPCPSRCRNLERKFHLDQPGTCSTAITSRASSPRTPARRS